MSRGGSADPAPGRRARLVIVRDACRARGLDGLLITSPVNIRWACGASDAAWALASRAEGLVLPYALGVDAARRDAAPGWRVLPPGDPFREAARAALRARLRRLGVDTAHLTVDRHAALVRELGRETLAVPAAGLVEAARETKDGGEIALTTRAAAIAVAVGRVLPGIVRPGVTERQAACEVDRRLLALGADGPAFETIVLGGPRTALPHGRPTGRVFRRGDLVLADWGARIVGYHSDMTRTWCLGRPSARQRSVYAAVYRAYRAGLRAVRAGRPAGAADRAARRALGTRARRFIHSLGHGVGLEIHESPRLHGSVRSAVPAGALVTVEPGVYEPGWGGIRLEDTVLVGRRGVRSLTGAPSPVLESVP